MASARSFSCRSSASPFACRIRICRVWWTSWRSSNSVSIWKARRGVWAAGRRTEQHLKQIAAALMRFEVQVANGSTDVLEHDVEFHLPLARASGNRYFYDVLSQMGRGVSPRTRLRQSEIDELDHIERLRHVLSEHKAIYQALVRQDADDARAAMRMHLSNSRERLRCGS